MYVAFKKLWHICCDHCGYIITQDLAKLAECSAAASQLAILTTYRLWAKHHLCIVCNYWFVCAVFCCQCLIGHWVFECSVFTVLLIKLYYPRFRSTEEVTATSVRDTQLQSRS